MLKKIIIGILALLVLIQFVPNELPEVKLDNKNDLLANNEFPAEIENQIRSSCYDCHSNETVYPWYSYVAPISFLVKRDTKEGRKELNFSDWESLNKKEKAKHLSDVIDEIDDGEMPFPPYLITHSDARMNDKTKQALMKWADSYAESLFE